MTLYLVQFECEAIKTFYNARRELLRRFDGISYGQVVFVDGVGTAAQLYQALAGLLGTGDKVFIAGIGDFASHNMEVVKQWLATKRQHDVNDYLGADRIVNEQM